MVRRWLFILSVRVACSLHHPFALVSWDFVMRPSGKGRIRFSELRMLFPVSVLPPSGHRVTPAGAAGGISMATDATPERDEVVDLDAIEHAGGEAA